MNDYYDITIKKWKLVEIEKKLANYTDSSWTLVKVSIAGLIKYSRI